MEEVSTVPGFFSEAVEVLIFQAEKPLPMNHV